MKVLMVNKFFYIKGGSETYYFALRRLLESHGHQVVDFSMEDARNFDSPTSRFFVAHTDYANAGSPAGKFRAAANIVYSFEAKRKFEALVREEQPDLVHLHLFQHQISPSILQVIKKYNLPTVYTAHDLKMVCLNYKMMHHGRICEDCKGGSLLPCLKNRCVKESLLKSAVNVCEGILHRLLRSYDAIDAIITPSAFYKRKFQAFGVPGERIVHIPNFLDAKTPEAAKRPELGRYFLYLGRLSEEKGVMTLIRAVQGTNLRLLIAGTGPLQEAIAQYLAAHPSLNVTLLGFKSGQELTDLIYNARAVVLPSEWYENGPYSAIEALQLSRPLLCADIGGLPELIAGNGFLFPAGDADTLRQRLLDMDCLDDGAYKAMERASRALFDSVYTQEPHYAALMQVYARAAAAHQHNPSF